MQEGLEILIILPYFIEVGFRIAALVSRTSELDSSVIPIDLAILEQAVIANQMTVIEDAVWLVELTEDSATMITAFLDSLLRQFTGAL